MKRGKDEEPKKTIAPASSPAPSPASKSPPARASSSPSSSSPPPDAAELNTPRRFADTSRCDLCGFLLAVEHHCKIVCPNCGYTRDCSDP